MKTVREWVETLIDPYKSIALKHLNIQPTIGAQFRSTFKDAICCLSWGSCQSIFIPRISWAFIANHPELYTVTSYKKYLKNGK